MRNPRLRLFFATLRAECGNRMKAAFALTPEERRVVLLVTGLFVAGLVARLIRAHYLNR